MNEMDLAIQEFLAESRENLDQLDRDLIAIERDADGREALDSIFRTFHTIKGTCEFFDFPGLEAVTHSAEGLLSALREGQLAWGDAITGVLLEVVAVVRRNLDSIGRDGTELTADHFRLIATVEDLRSLPPGPPDARPAPEAGPTPTLTPTPDPGPSAPPVPPTSSASTPKSPKAPGRARGPSASTSASWTS